MLTAINDLGRAWRADADAVSAAVSRVMDSGWYVGGPEVAGFERAFAGYCGVDHCVGVANGTDALTLALKALGVGPGDAVATAANAGGYASTAIRLLGARPVHVDIDPAAMTMDPAALARAVASERLAAVVATHLYGRLADIEGLLAAAGGVPLVEDCAQAHGASLRGRRAGAWGAIGCFSFYPTKNLGALGDGGAVATRDAALAERVRRLGQYGWSGKYRIELAGGTNSRLDALQAAVLAVRLEGLDAANARRRALAERYRARLAGTGLVLPAAADEAYVAHLYVVRSPARDALAAFLRAGGVPCDVHYPVPDHRQPAWSDPAVRLPHTEAAAAQVLTLPLFPAMTDSEVDAVADAVRRWSDAR